MKTKIFFVAVLGALSLGVTSCKDVLDEYNPGGGTFEQYAQGKDYDAMVNQCYFAMCRFFYGTADGTSSWGGNQMNAGGYMALSEANTDLWTSAVDIPTNQPNYFYFMNGANDTQYLNNFWNCAYDGIGACNTAIHYSKYNTYYSAEKLNQFVAEARMMRAVYYFNLVEMFGGVVKTVSVGSENITYSPKRTAPLDIYKDIIIPDLDFAAKNLEIGDDKSSTRPTRKAAIAFLAKAYLQMTRWTTDANEKANCYGAALAQAEELINDCEAGGKKYNVHLYDTVDEVFAESNNFENKEALWKQRWVLTSSGAYTGSTGKGNFNRNDSHFNCWLAHFGARENTVETHQTWEGARHGDFMPTQHLLSLYVQADGTLDPRFHKWFTTEWKSNKSDGYAWTESDCKTYGKDASLVGTKINNGDLAIKITMPQDADYATEVANAATSNYLLVDYKKLYSDAQKEIIQNGADGNENQLRYFWPVLNKHNSSNYAVENLSKYRVGNLNATFIMRTPEVYLIAAEAALQTNQPVKVKTYIDKIRNRAGAKEITNIDLRTILDERGRELCGEYNRFFDLVRTGYLNTQYLNETHPNLAKFFKPEYVLKPIPQQYIDLLENGSDFVNPGY